LGKIKFGNKGFINLDWLYVFQGFLCFFNDWLIMPLFKSKADGKALVRFDAIQFEEKPYDSPYTTSTSSTAKNVYDLGINKDSGTLATWFLTKTSDTTRYIIGNDEEASTRRYFLLRIGSDNKVQVYYKHADGTSGVLLTSNQAVSPNQWYFTSLSWKTVNGVLTVTLQINNEHKSKSTSDFTDFSGTSTVIGSSLYSSLALNGYMEQFLYSPENLSDTVLDSYYNN
jgi:hypothetical protein